MLVYSDIVDLTCLVLSAKQLFLCLSTANCIRRHCVCLLQLSNVGEFIKKTTSASYLRRFLYLPFMFKSLMYFWLRCRLSIRHTRANWQSESSTSYELGWFSVNRQRFPVHSRQVEGPTEIVGIYSVGQWQQGKFLTGYINCSCLQNKRVLLDTLIVHLSREQTLVSQVGHCELAFRKSWRHVPQDYRSRVADALCIYLMDNWCIYMYVYIFWWPLRAREIGCSLILLSLLSLNKLMWAKSLIKHSIIIIVVIIIIVAIK